MLEEIAENKILYYSSMIRLAQANTLSDPERLQMRNQADKAQAHMYQIETKHKNILAAVPKY